MARGYGPGYSRRNRRQRIRVVPSSCPPRRPLLPAPSRETPSPSSALRGKAIEYASPRAIVLDLVPSASAQRPAQPVRSSGLFAWASLSKHLLQPSQDGRNGLRCEPPEGTEKALGVDGTELVQSDEARSALKAAPHSPRVCAPSRRHRRNDHSAQVLVQLVRGNDETGASLLNVAAERRIQPNEVDFAAGPGVRVTSTPIPLDRSGWRWAPRGGRHGPCRAWRVQPLPSRCALAASLGPQAVQVQRAIRPHREAAPDRGGPLGHECPASCRS